MNHAVDALDHFVTVLDHVLGVSTTVADALDHAAKNVVSRLL